MIMAALVGSEFHPIASNRSIGRLGANPTTPTRPNPTSSAQVHFVPEDPQRNLMRVHRTRSAEHSCWTSFRCRVSWLKSGCSMGFFHLFSSCSEQSTPVRI